MKAKDAEVDIAWILFSLEEQGIWHAESYLEDKSAVIVTHLQVF